MRQLISGWNSTQQMLKCFMYASQFRISNCLRGGANSKPRPHILVGHCSNVKI